MELVRKFAFRLDPYFVNTQIYFLSGFGYLQSPNKWMNALYATYRFFCFFSMTLTFSVQILDVYLLLDDTGKLMEDLCAILVTFDTVIKMYVISYRTHEIESLHREFLRFRKSRRHPEEEEIWSNASNLIYKMTKAFYALGGACVLFWIFFPALDNTSERSLPYPWVFPVDYRLSPLYEIIYVAQSIALVSFLINIVSIDLGYCSYIVLVVAQFDILARDIRIMSSAYDPSRSNADRTAKKGGSGRTEESLKMLGDAVKIHSNILRQIEKLHAIHSDILFGQMSLTALVLAILLVDTVVNSRELSLKLFQRLLYTLSASFDAWIMCYWGTQLKEKSHSFCQELYNSTWIEMDVRVRRILMVIMMKAQRAPKLKNGMLSFELPLFLEILKYSYNVTALLKTR